MHILSLLTTIVQWVAANSNKQAVFHKKLPVHFISQNGLTPEEEIIKARQGLFDRLQDLEALEIVGISNLRGQGEANEGQPTEAQEASVSLIQTPCLVPNIDVGLLADPRMAALGCPKYDSKITLLALAVLGI